MNLKIKYTDFFLDSDLNQLLKKSLRQDKFLYEFEIR